MVSFNVYFVAISLVIVLITMVSIYAKFLKTNGRRTLYDLHTAFGENPMHLHKHAQDTQTSDEEQAT